MDAAEILAAHFLEPLTPREVEKIRELQGRGYLYPDWLEAAACVWRHPLALNSRMFGYFVPFKDLGPGGLLRLKRLAVLETSALGLARDIRFKICDAREPNYRDVPVGLSPDGEAAWLADARTRHAEKKAADLQEVDGLILKLEYTARGTVPEHNFGAAGGAFPPRIVRAASPYKHDQLVKHNERIEAKKGPGF